MQNYTRNMRQTATYWPPNTPDGFGGFTPGTAEVIKCRWQDTNVLFRNFEGQEVMSEAVVYVEKPLVNKGMLALGTFTGTPPASAREIRRSNTTPNLGASYQLSKVYI